MQKLGVEEGEAIEHRWVTKAIENAQRKVEGRNFDIRKQLLEYDDVANDQRREIYALRDELMSTEDVSEMYETIRADVVNAAIDGFIPRRAWTSCGRARPHPGAGDRVRSPARPPGLAGRGRRAARGALAARILDAFGTTHAEKEKVIGAQTMRAVEKAVMLQVLDVIWKEHLAAMDYLRQGIHLRGYAQKNPSRSTSASPSRCFAPCWSGSRRTWCGSCPAAKSARGPARRTRLAAASRAGGVFTRGDERACARSGDGHGLGAGQRRCAGRRRRARGAGAGDGSGPRAGRGAGGPAVRADGPEGRTQRALPLRLGRKYKHCHGRLH